MVAANACSNDWHSVIVAASGGGAGAEDNKDLLKLAGASDPDVLGAISASVSEILLLKKWPQKTAYMYIGLSIVLYL